MSGRKTVLVVDDDPGILRVLGDGLSSVLDLFDVVTAGNGVEAIEALERRPIDVLVTDLAMPVMDGFALIAYVTNRRSAMPVVVLSGMVGAMLDQRLAGYGRLRVLRKPASYQEVATCVLEEIERVDRGQIEGIPLAGVLQLVEAERRSCRVVVTSGRRRGHLDFESGRLINAFSDDFGAEGEAAAYDVLGWPDTAIEFEPLPASARRLIRTPMQLLLVELAAAQDREREGAVGAASTAERTATDEEAATDEPEPAPVDAPFGTPVDGTFGDPTAEAARPDPTGDAWDHEPVDVGMLGDAREPAAPGDPDDPTPPRGGEADGAPALADADEPEGVDDSLFLDDPVPDASDAAEVAPERPVPDPPAALDDAGAAAPPAPRPPAAVAGPAAEAPEHVRDMLAAIERLAQRAKTADEALAAVASEIAAFREAQQRFDAEIAQREQRRRDLERFRDEVGQLAREILGRVDGLFDAMGGDAAPRDAGGDRPAT